jgi:hypothetical protein
VDGSWVVFEMTNVCSYDVPANYDVEVGPAGGPYHEFHGEELLQANATQQGHYLLPEDLDDGSYTVSVTGTVQGNLSAAGAELSIQVSGGVITALG